MPPSSGEGGGGNSGEEPEEPEEPTAPTEAEEAQYHVAIVQAYNNLSQYEQAIQGVIQEFNDYSMSLSSDTRYVCFQNCAGTVYSLDLVADLRVPVNLAGTQPLRGLISSIAIYQVRDTSINVLGC